MTLQDPPSGLDLRPGTRVWVGGNDLAAKRALDPFLVRTVRPPSGPIDAAFIAPLSDDEAWYFARKILPRLATDGAIWVVTSGTAEPPPLEIEEKLDALASLLNPTRNLAVESIRLDAVHRAVRFRDISAERNE